MPVAEERKPNTTPYIEAFKRRMPGVVDIPLECYAEAPAAVGRISVPSGGGNDSAPCGSSQIHEIGDTDSGAQIVEKSAEHIQPVEPQAQQDPAADDAAENSTFSTQAGAEHSKAALALSAASEAGWCIVEVSSAKVCLLLVT
jgi:hypothetical protein